MTAPPPHPKIYHITHVDNLPGIVAECGLLSEAALAARAGQVHVIGMSSIKLRRLNELEVPCYVGTKVGDYVPFYFCPRSVMLYVIHCANHQELTYRGGQDPIIHLEADLHNVVQWATHNGVRWAFSLSNAGAYYTEFRAVVAHLNQLDWVAIATLDFRQQNVKEGKQAEFLVHGRFPFSLVSYIGVRSTAIAARVSAVLAGTNYSPIVQVRPDWYF